MSTNSPSPDPVPDHVSHEALLGFLRNAPNPEQDGRLPIGTAVPHLPLNDNADFGAVDLVLALDQILQAAGGATNVHLLHGSTFLLSIAVDTMERRLVALDDDINAELGGFAGLVFKATARSLIDVIKSCIDKIDDFVTPLTAVHADSLGGGPNSRLGLISDGTLTALGIDIETYDREFKRRSSF
jgi:hypothetical protein